MRSITRLFVAVLLPTAAFAKEAPSTSHRRAGCASRSGTRPPSPRRKRALRWNLTPKRMAVARHVPRYSRVTWPYCRRNFPRTCAWPAQAISTVSWRPSRAGSRSSSTLSRRSRAPEPWNQVSFTGPVAAIASITAQAAGDGVELQLLAGTVTEPQPKGGPAKVIGLLGADRAVSLRWQSKAAEAARKALVTCETTAAAHITPAVVKLTTRLNYEIVQGKVPEAHT